MGAIRKYFKPIMTAGFKLFIEGPKLRRMALHKDKYSYDERYENAMRLIKYATKKLDAEFRINGIEKIPEENVLFAVNHQSYFDPFISQILPKRTVWIAKKEIRKFPFIGNIAESIDTLFFDRDNIREAVKMIDKANEVLKNGQSLWVSMEGTRSKKADHSMNEFKSGALKPAYTTHTTIVPMVICGSWKVLDPKYCKKPVLVDVYFFEPIKYEDYKNIPAAELSHNLYEMMKAKDDELLEYHLHN